MAERQATESLSAIKPLLVTEEAECTREPRSKAKHGTEDSTSKNRKGFTEASDENSYTSDTPTRLRPRGLKWRGKYYAQDESGTLILPPEQLPEQSNFGPQYVRYSRDSKRTKFEEAALYIREGKHNEKFASHPNGRYSKIAYNIVHHPAFYLTDFVATVLLMCLAIFEDPAIINFQPEYKAYVIVTHASLEFFFLTIIGSNILLRFIWMKPRTFLKQRTMLAAIVLLVMYVEATVVITNQKSHFRVLRCLRIIFFVDTYIMSGVRRVLRQILQCLKPIFDVMVLLFLMVAIFALIAYYLFAEVNRTFFDTYVNSFVSMFITLTTANHPTVFMEAYFENSLTPIFFFIYLLITLYFFSNVLLAVVYANFSDEEKRKFKKLFLHKREALRLAFGVLQKDGHINFKDFLMLMEEYRPRVPEYQVLCIFKALQNKPKQRQEDAAPNNLRISLKEFYNFYVLQNMKWKRFHDGHAVRWYENFPDGVQKWFERLHGIVHFHFFNSIMAVFVFLNAFYLIFFTLLTSYHCGSNGVVRYGGNPPVNSSLTTCCGKERLNCTGSLAGSFIFNSIYLVEIAMRILAVGPIAYFRKWWNKIDFFIIVGSFICLCIEADAKGHPALQYLIVVRPIKFFRVLRLKRRYYNLMNTMFILTHRMLSVLLLLVIVYYFFAIIGMEVFNSKVYAGCCQTALFGVAGEYTGNATTKGNDSIYWLNNFDNIYQSYVILYEEMVVNNWYLQMEGFVSETNIFARFYFISFWICMTIVVSVVIAYIVDAFVFKIQSVSVKKHCEIHGEIYDCNCHESYKKLVEVKFKGEEINMLLQEIDSYDRKRKKMSFSDTVRRINRIDLDSLPGRIVFSGRRLRTKEDLNLQMYKSELEGWVSDRELERPMEERGAMQTHKSFREKFMDKLKALAFFILE